MPDPVALSKEELAEVKRQSEMQVHHDYIIPRLLATIASRDQRIKELAVALQDLCRWTPGVWRENPESPALRSWDKAYEVLHRTPAQEEGK